MKNSNPNGVHFLINFYGCEKEQISSIKFWKEILPLSLKGTKLSILKSFFYEFDPQGVTGFLLLSSSHLSIHTWPENHYAACDIFSCSDMQETKKIVDFLVREIKHSKVEIKNVIRGFQHC